MYSHVANRSSSVIIMLTGAYLPNSLGFACILDFKELGILMTVKLFEPNMYSEIVVTELGIVNVSNLFLEKLAQPNVFTLPGIVTLTNEFALND